MSKAGKRIRTAREGIDRTKAYPVEEAVKLIKSSRRNCNSVYPGIDQGSGDGFANALRRAGYEGGVADKSGHAPSPATRVHTAPALLDATHAAIKRIPLSPAAIPGSSADSVAPPAG